MREYFTENNSFSSCSKNRA